MDGFDYLIIGGGSAASVLAARLSEDGTRRVLVLEAGPPDSNPYIQIPAGFIKTLFDPKVTWQFTSEPSAGTAGRRIQITQGKTLGGSSAVNGGVYNRGQRLDFDTWAQLGNPGWSYDDVLPYFRRTERRVGAADPQYRGDAGALPVTTPDWPSAICDAFLETATAHGMPRNDDYNGGSQLGCGRYQAAILNGRRHSAAKAFLHPAGRRPNVEIRTRALVTRVELQDRRAVGVAYLDGSGVMRRVRARQGVIVSAGVLGSPKILQLSGIGPAELLRAHGIEVQHHLPGVGENLRDHYSPRFVFRARNGETLNSHVRGLALAGQAIRWLRGRPSVLSLAPALCFGFGKTEPTLEDPDFSLVFTPASYRAGRIGELDTFPGITCGVWQMRPESLGHVRIRSSDPRVLPEVDPRYLSSKHDQRILVAALKRAAALFHSAPMTRHIAAWTLPQPEPATDDGWLDFARNYGSSSYHLIGSCRMGQADAPLTVVDARLKVHGVEGLYVVDASIMPTMPSANTYASTLMIAEKASDMLIGRPR